MGPWRRRTRDERGAAAVFTAACLAVLVAMAAFAVDLGMQRVLRRDMQALADVVALDMARHVDGRKQAVIKDAVDKYLADSVARNTDLEVGDFKLEHKSEDALLRSEVSDLVVRARLGTMDPATGKFTETGKQEVPDAVRVSASSTVDFAFATGSGAAGRSAVAQAEGGACFAIGSYAARLDTGESALLGPVLDPLGISAGLTALDYRGLANANVDLAGLLGADVGAVTLQEALDADVPVDLGEFATVVKANLLAKSEDRTGAVDVLNGVIGLPTIDFTPVDILSVSTGGSAGLAGELNAYDLITAAAIAANGENALALPVDVDLGSLGTVSATAEIVEPMQMVCGRVGEAQARTSQVKLSLDGPLDVDSIVPEWLGSLSVSVNGQRHSPNYDTQFALAGLQATGTLSEVRCSPPGITVDMTGGLAWVDLGLTVKGSVLSDVDLPGPLDEVTEPLDFEISVVVDATYAETTTSVDVAYEEGTQHTETVDLGVIPDINPALTVEVGDGAIDLSPEGGLQQLIVDEVVTPLIDSLQVLEGPLTGALGEQLGLSLVGADVSSRPEPRCNAPVLRR